MKTRVLFVCLGNICRSPLAEGLARAKAENEGRVGLEFESAATGGWHIGKPPDARAVVAARIHGIDISEQRARAISSADFARFDLIIAMDRSVADDVERLRPRANRTPVELMTRYGDQLGSDVPDPYYSGKFEPVIALLEACMPGLFAKVQTPEQ